MENKVANLTAMFEKKAKPEPRPVRRTNTTKDTDNNNVKNMAAMFEKKSVPDKKPEPSNPSEPKTTGGEQKEEK